MDTREAGRLGGLVGGKSRSEAKLTAARANGRRGGRRRGVETRSATPVPTQPMPTNQSKPPVYVLTDTRKEESK